MTKEQTSNRLSSSDELERVREAIIRSRDLGKPCVAICGGTGCLALGVNGVITAFKREIQEQGLEAKVDIKITGCPGFCERGPLVVIEPGNTLYQRVKAEDVPELFIDKHGVLFRRTT